MIKGRITEVVQAANLVNKMFTERETNVKVLHVPMLQDLRSSNDTQNNTSRSSSRTNNVHERDINPKLEVNINANHTRTLKAIHPIINAEAFALTMDRYRIFVSQLNEQRRKENIEIENHNHNARKFVPNDIQKPFLQLFLRKNRNLSAPDYNKLVDEFEKERGILTPKKKLHIVKYQSELLFQHFLYEYSLQLQENTKVFKDLGQNEPRPIKMLEINSYKIVMQTRNGHQSIDICQETVKNHRKRLLEAGVLINYTFCGHKRGIKTHINPEILAIFDLFTEKITITENQHFNPRTAKSFGNSKEVTVTEHKENQIKENVDNNSLKKCNATPLQGETILNNNNYNNTNSQDEKSKLGGGEKIVKSSEKLRQKIENEYDFAENLTKGKYHNYTPIDIRQFFNESMYGILSREEFKELIIQDFLKSAARLYKNSTPYFGSWLKAYRMLIENEFMVNGNLHNKALMVDKLQEYRWRLHHAERWFTRHNEVKILFPSDYFDFSRTKAKEIGFGYTKKAYLKHKKYVETTKTDANKKRLERERTISNDKKFVAAFNKFKRRDISLPEMIEYVKNNLSIQFEQRFINEYQKFIQR